MTIDQAFIFAAGRGERMKPLTDSIPKPLVKVFGKAMIDHIIEKLNSIPTIKKIIINAYYLSDMIKSHIDELGNSKIILSKESEKLETGGGLVNALPLFDKTKPILLINGDVIWRDDAAVESTLTSIIAGFDESKMDILLGLKAKDQFMGYEGNGDFAFDKSTGDLSKPENAAQLDYVFSGMQIIHPRILQNCPASPFSMNHFYKQARQDNGSLKGIKGLELKGEFFHVGDVKTLEKINGGN